MVRLLRNIREKEVAEKFYRRTLKLFREPIINQIAKNHNIDRKMSISEKIEKIINDGVSLTSILTIEIYKDGISLTEKKKFLAEVVEKGLGIQNLKGNTLEDKI